ncbi:MAG: hypothetical protein LBU76_07050 [Azoarcus sp.]|jgi:hypothetical protein|nr:hypothetical protein [Azoarcus sp.]
MPQRLILLASAAMTWLESGHMATNITFDTLKYVETLEAAGIPRNQAKAQAEAQAASLYEVLEISRHDVATKGDIAVLKSDIAMMRQEIVQLEQRMTIKLGTMLTIAVGAVVALTKLL